MDEREFEGLLGRLRSPERIARLEIGRVAKKRVTILESAYSEFDGGLATAHRVKPDALNAMALAVGF